MAKIVDKAYNAAKRIARTIFLGSPSLFTSADLNRQIEALQAQINRLEGVTSVRISPLNDYDLSVNLSNHTLRFYLEPYEDDETSLDMHLFARGCDFNLGNTQIMTPAVTFSESNVSSWRVIAQLGSPVTVHFEDDPTHEIAGAKFQDGTSAAAADQIVYPNNVSIILRSGGNLAENEILLAEITLDGTTGDYLIDAAFNTWDKPVGLGMKNQLSYRYNPKAIITTPQVGHGFNSLFSHLFRSAVPVGTILPFYGDLSTVLPYGWIPCTALIASVIYYHTDFSDYQIVKDYQALYGNNISFEVVKPDGNTSSTMREYFRITQCRGVTIPDLTSKFLPGAAAIVAHGKDYEKGDEGGENQHLLTIDELPSHDHISAIGENRTMCIPQWGFAERYSGNNQLGTQGSDEDNSLPLTSPTGGGQRHENRPPYHAVYYIMRVC